MKTKYILHGGFTSEDNQKNIDFFNECFVDASQVSNILIVLFASENDGDIEYFSKLSDRLRSYTKKELNLEKANRKDFISQVKKANKKRIRYSTTASSLPLSK